jgi:phospholipid/cholesterol/gamma-HCH transport system permease protein
LSVNLFMAASSPSPAVAEVSLHAGELRVRLGGDWLMESGELPSWRRLLDEHAPGARKARAARIDASALGEWDSSVLLLLSDARHWARAGGRKLNLADVPPALEHLLDQLPDAPEKRAHSQDEPPRSPAEQLRRFSTMVGSSAQRSSYHLDFLGQCAAGFARLAVRPGNFRWADSVGEMQRAGAMALPIVGLISFLVGVIMAYQGVLQLRTYGADMFVANLVALTVVREMGPMMTAIVLAGRTGAAFAAELGNMKLNEEIDALETLGARPIDFLVVPRMLALFLMLPLLALYANALGIFGGMVVTATAADIPPSAYWAQVQSAVSLTDVATGLIKSVAFGALIGYAGCLRGMQSERSAAGVGAATTSAVVTGILLIIVADAIFAVIFNALNW